MRRHRNRHRHKHRKIIILSLICFLFIMVGGYAAFSTNLNITAKGNILEKDRVIQSWTSTSNEDFHTDYYRENIVSATFLDNNNVPDNATESWNVSENKAKGGVMAWVIPNSEDNTKYDLYIGVNGGVIANVDSSFLFNCFPSLITIDFGNNFDTSNVTNMRNMFSPVIQSTSIILESSLTEIKGLENWDVSKVTNMNYMFECNPNLTNVSVENWDTSSLVRMQGLFSYCNFASLDLSKWNTSHVSDMGWLFAGNTNLTKLTIGNWNTSNVSSMLGMFFKCSNLESLNLCHWNTVKVTNMRNMFSEMSKVTNIYVGEQWTMDNVTDGTNMFLNSNVSEVTSGEC